MGHFGFSYVGLVFLLMLFVPNIIWARNMPEGYSSEGESRVLGAFERIGEVLCTACALVFSDFDLRPWSAWSLWLIGAFGLMVLYELWWVRYFRSRRTLSDFYGSFLGVPVPGAVLPVAAFILLGIWGKVIWMVLSAVILGIGHIGIHLRHRAEYMDKQ